MIFLDGNPSLIKFQMKPSHSYTVTHTDVHIEAAFLEKSIYIKIAQNKKILGVYMYKGC